MTDPTPKAKCPTCGQPTQHQWRPFCSRRCADIDLGRWFLGRYRIPGEPAEIPDAEPGAEPGED